MNIHQVILGFGLGLALGTAQAGTPPNAYLTISPWGGPATINFPNQAVGTTSTPQNTTLTATEVPNDPGYAVQIQNISISPSGEFSKGAGCNPGTVLDNGENCAFPTTFTPSTAGARSAAYSITCSVVSLATVSNIICNNTPQTVISLNGTGFVLSPIPSLGRVGLTFLAVSLLGFALLRMRRA